MRVLLIDDHPPIRLAVKTVLELEDSLQVVGEAGSSEDALPLTRELEPDFVVLDLRLRGHFSGIELCREIKSLPDPPLVLIYTAYNSPRELASCCLSGADAYVHKSEDATALVGVIESACSGGRGRWLPGTQVEDPEAQLQAARQEGSLTERELEVYSLLLDHRTNPEIATELSISPETVKTHVTNVLDKLGCESRREIS